MADCNNDDFSKITSCLGVKAVTAIDRASRMHTISLVPGITLLNEDTERNSRSLVTEEEVTSQLEKEGDKSGRLLEMIFDNAAKFLQTHTVQFKLPMASEEVSRALDEGRGKLSKKKFTPILMLLGAKIFAILPIIIGVVGIMAVKALFIGKLAILLAGFLAIQKFASGSGFGGGLGKLSPDSYVSGPSSSHSAGWSAPAAGAAPSGGYYKRSYQDAQNMAYSAQTPETS
ncbi:uncharacterized protein LOC103507677 isoform X2 [Diaphorina citri]|nr:uncharacterized protein LOC103507677 isoform X2 [Diaphorina citri]